MCVIVGRLFYLSGNKIIMVEKLSRITDATGNPEGRWAAKTEQVRLSRPDPVQCYEIASYYPGLVDGI